MSHAHQRKKQPEQVRRALLDNAARLAAEHGIVGVTVQAVAEAAGVTKGGLFHHFPNKKAMVDAVFEDLLEQCGQRIDALLAEDAVPHGRFTRAYVKVLFEENSQNALDPWMALSMSMVTEPSLQQLWGDWMSRRLAQHRDTDNDPSLEIVRLAADGAWLAFMSQTHQVLMPDVDGLRARLIALTTKT
jgi:AcrR family transcriptional regulator